MNTKTARAKNCKTEASAEIFNQSNRKFKGWERPGMNISREKHFESAASSFDARKFIDSRSDHKLGR